MSQVSSESDCDKGPLNGKSWETLMKDVGDIYSKDPGQRSAFQLASYSTRVNHGSDMPPQVTKLYLLKIIGNLKGSPETAPAQAVAALPQVAQIQGAAPAPAQEAKPVPTQPRFVWGDDLSLSPPTPREAQEIFNWDLPPSRYPPVPPQGYDSSESPEEEGFAEEADSSRSGLEDDLLHALAVPPSQENELQNLQRQLQGLRALAAEIGLVLPQASPVAEPLPSQSTAASTPDQTTISPSSSAPLSVEVARSPESQGAPAALPRDLDEARMGRIRGLTGEEVRKLAQAEVDQLTPAPLLRPRKVGGLAPLADAVAARALQAMEPRKHMLLSPLPRI